MPNTTTPLPEDQHINDEDTKGIDKTEWKGEEGDLDITEKEIKIDKNDRSLFQLKTWYDEEDLDTKPPWQRGDVWNNKQRSRLIESFLMGIPVPVIYLAQVKKVKEGKNTTIWEVIDGKQRLNAVFMFMNNKYALSGLESEGFENIKKKKFSKLDSNLQKKLKNATLRTFELPVETSKNLLYLTFNRLNTGGTKLNPMEIRNCIYPGALITLIKDLAKTKEFTDLAGTKGKRMEHETCVLRFLAFYQQRYDKSLKKGLTRFLNCFCEGWQELKPKKETEYRKAFKKAMIASKTVFGEDAFKLRNKKGPGFIKKINFGVFQYKSVLFTDYDLHQITQKADAIRQAHEDLIQNEEGWSETIRKDNGTHIKKTFKTWENKLEEIMGDTLPLDSKRFFSPEDKETLYTNDPTCQLCKQRIPDISLAEVDHIIPYAQGGRTMHSNGRLVHSICNKKRTCSS